MKTQKIFPPPSGRHILKIQEYLQRGNSHETSATLAGVPKKCFLFWVERGRLGDSEFVALTEMLDAEDAKLSGLVMEDLYTRAFQGRELGALQFLYKARLAHREQRFQKQVDEIEDRIEAKLAEGGSEAPTEEELLALEAGLEQREVH